MFSSSSDASTCFQIETPSLETLLSLTLALRTSQTSVRILLKDFFSLLRLLGQVEISLLEARRRGEIAVKRYNLEDDKHHPVIVSIVKSFFKVARRGF